MRELAAAPGESRKGQEGKRDLRQPAPVYGCNGLSKFVLVAAGRALGRAMRVTEGVTLAALAVPGCSLMPRKLSRPDAQISRLATELGRRWVPADGIEPWLRRQLPRLTILLQDEGWSWDDIGRAMTVAGITYATGRTWTGRQLARKAAEARAQGKRRQRASAPATAPYSVVAGPTLALPPPATLPDAGEGWTPPPRRAFGFASLRGWTPDAEPVAKVAVPPPRPARVVDADAVIAALLNRPRN